MSSRWRKFLNNRFWPTMTFLGLTLPAHPPIIVNESTVNLADMVHIPTILDELEDSFVAVEEDGDFCSCFTNGFAEACQVVEYLANEQLEVNMAVAKLHDDLDALSRGEI